MDVADVVKVVFARVVAGDAQGLFDLFSPRAREALPLEKTAATLAGIVAARGAWKSVERTEGETSLTRGTWLVKAERGEWKLHVGLDEEGRIAGIAMTEPGPDLKGIRTAEALVATLETTLGPLPPRVRDAILSVDRARFARACDQELAYENIALPLDTPHGPLVPSMRALLDEHGTLLAIMAKGILGASGSTISQPLIYAGAFKALGLAERHRYLDIGSGTGYGAALASHIVGPNGRVTSMDVDPHLVAEAARLTRDCGNVSVLHADGLAAADLLRDHDRAWITFAVTKVPDTLTDALAEGAVLLAPVGPSGGMQMLTHHTRANGELVVKPIAPVRFSPARGLVPGA
ncbi:MAG: methyltransferase domain-containing protein [Polyangiaceae bacterium]